MAAFEMRVPVLRRLYVQVVIAALLGVAAGLLFPGFAVAMEPLGEGFVKLVRLIIAPLVFCTLVLGMAGCMAARRAGWAARRCSISKSCPRWRFWSG